MCLSFPTPINDAVDMCYIYTESFGGGLHMKAVTPPVRRHEQRSSISSYKVMTDMYDSTVTLL